MGSQPPGSDLGGTAQNRPRLRPSGFATAQGEPVAIRPSDGHPRLFSRWCRGERFIGAEPLEDGWRVACSHVSRVADFPRSFIAEDTSGAGAVKEAERRIIG